MEELAPQMSIHQDRQDYVAKFEDSTASPTESPQRNEREDLDIVEMLAEMPLQFSEDEEWCLVDEIRSCDALEIADMFVYNKCTVQNLHC